MSFTLSSLSIHDRQKNVHIDQIPAISKPMLTVISQLHPESEAPAALSNLRDRAYDLAQATKLLKHAENHSTRDKILGVLATAGLALLVASTVVGFLFNPLVGAGLLVLTLGYIAACGIKAENLGKEEWRTAQNCLKIYPIGVLFGPIALSYLLLTRASSLKSTEAEFNRTVVDLTAKSYDYWGQHGNRLTARVNRELDRVDDSLLGMKWLPIRSAQGENTLQEYRKLLVNLRGEVKKGIDLAHLFRPPAYNPASGF